MRIHKPIRTMALGLLIFAALVSANFLFKSSAQVARPVEFDIRGPQGVPKGTALHQPVLTQLKALESLKGTIGNSVQVRYNGLTATPRYMFSYSAYLTPPSTAAPESIARNFLSRYRELFRFSDTDLNNLKLQSRATLPDMGTTIMLFEQRANGLPVYHGDVLVNVNRAGQIISVGGESFPQLRVTNAATLTPEQAINAAALAMGITNLTLQPAGTRQVLTTYGNLPAEYVEAPQFTANVIKNKIVVTRTVFPLGDTGRMAYKFALTTPQFDGITWENVVDAQTGQVLRRFSLTSFYGPHGGGQGVGRLPTFRPDVQDKLESQNPNGTAAGKVFDGMPTTLSGPAAFGRPATPGMPPAYGAETAATAAEGRGFKQSFVFARNENPLVYGAPYGQVLRGLPDASNPSPQSPFGWFYLPTDSNGAEINNANANRAATRAYGYTMDTEAQGRNVPENSPVADKSQPFSVTLAPLGSSVVLADGRTLSAVLQSNYTEGNNVLVADDHADDDEGTQGIKGYDANRQFTASRFDFTNSYEFGGVDAGGTPFFPPSTFADVYPGTTTLFYYNNLIHDYLYSIGFTEQLWNFQQDNFGKGGAGGDGISAQVQDGSGTDNANFSTPGDGTTPRMQMYLFTDANARRADGDLDFDVVAHEHYHGVSNRSAAKGGTGGLGFALVGESGGQGEGWSDYNAASLTDDDVIGEYVIGDYIKAIRFLPYTNFRWSYGAINDRAIRPRRDGGTPDPNTSTAVYSGPPFTSLWEVHAIGTYWCAVLWDMRELLIMKDPNGIFFDGARRLGNGTSFYIGSRRVQSVDGRHPIDYRASFNTQDVNTINAGQAIVRPGMLAAEIAQLGHRQGPIASAVSKGARLSDTLVLRGLQLSPSNPSFVDSRDSILLADRELTGGENHALIWRAFASHGVGANAESTTDPGNNVATQSAPLVIEDFTVPAGVTDCEALGPLPAPPFTLANLIKNQVTININDGVRVRDAQTYIISRASSVDGPFITIAEIPAIQTVFRDTNNGQGLSVGQTFYYQVRASRNPECVSPANTRSVAITLGDVISIATPPIFDGVDQVTDTRECNRLVVSWRPAFSAIANANLVYDIYRVTAVAAGDGTQAPTFTPTASNRIASGVNGTSYIDRNLVLGQIYYYIVQARDLTSGKKDTNNAGNTVTRYNAPTTSAVAATPVFAMENFENASANNRFVPPLVDSGNTPNGGAAAFQRVAGANLGGGLTSAVMYAPDFVPVPDVDPTTTGQPSDISTVIGPLTLTTSSLMEFDHRFSAETSFDGGVIEVALGAPIFIATPFPDNVHTFDVGNYIIEGGYNARFDGNLEGVVTSILQSRRGYTGSKDYHHVRIALGSFAAGGANNPLGLPVFLRFRMTSDANGTTGVNGGWFIDNLVINNLISVGCPIAMSAAPDDASTESDDATSRTDLALWRRRLGYV
jgi:Fungalysin metallopeptidase (M36)/Fungalysin/Thermolysin Propeptide Motif